MLISEVFKTTCIMLFDKSIKIQKLFRLREGTDIVTSNAEIEIGSHFSLGSFCHISSVDGGKITIGDNVFINRNVTVVSRGSINIGSSVCIGPNVCFYDHDHEFDSNGVYGQFKVGNITIGKNVWVGAGAIILKNTVIGEGSVIGAGTIVSGTIPPHSIVTNNREIIIKTILDK